MVTFDTSVIVPWAKDGVIQVAEVANDRMVCRVALETSEMRLPQASLHVSKRCHILLHGSHF